MKHPIEILSDKFISDWKQTFSREKYPRERPILSDISDCDRQIVYGITNWMDRPDFDEGLLARFEAGNVQEAWINKKINSDLQRYGDWALTNQQDVCEIKGRNAKGDIVLLARGKIDGILSCTIDGVKYKFPAEIKSFDPNVFRKIKSLDDFKYKPHLRKYLRQMQMYLFSKNYEAGVFIITDCLGHIKLLIIYLDYAECELILKRLESVHNHINAGTLPDRIKYDPSVCVKCSFAALCLPDVVNKELDMLDLPQMNEDLLRIEILKPFADEHDYLLDYNKEKAKAYGNNFIVGEFMASFKEQQTTRYEIPEDIKLKYAVKKPTTLIEFSRLIPEEKKDTGELPEKKDINDVRREHGDKPKRKKKK